MEFGFPDHHNPPLDLLFKVLNPELNPSLTTTTIKMLTLRKQIVLSMDNWLKASPQHVAVVHCVVCINYHDNSPTGFCLLGTKKRGEVVLNVWFLMCLGRQRKNRDGDSVLSDLLGFVSTAFGCFGLLREETIKESQRSHSSFAEKVVVMRLL